ncbi:hypothetical protein G1K75_06065 [Tenacibaculum finnmarkense]|uniref:hypothetical protein n=1 Tax=Tenacibaculum finnmarkense TaxID=2781243 RepID=UPI001EFBC2DA|nr:hypothetical protein [Tenacibaculum finnmarkense]MCG8805219.1 hypothetical protein [Tenacibaculum finnmarkense]
MDDIIKYILILLTIIFFISIWIILLKYVLIPLTKPRLSMKESIDFLEKNNCIYVEHLSLKKNELRENYFKRKKGISLRKVLSTKSEYKIIGYSETENLYKIYWIEITSWSYTFGKGTFEFLIDDTIEKRRELKSIEETNLKILENLQSDYNVKTVIVSDKCPACGVSVLPKDLECKECGLNYRN